MSPFTRHAVNTTSQILLALAISGCGGDEKKVIVQGGGSPPPMPTNLTAYSPGSGQVVLDWVFVPVATSYVVYWSTSPGVTKANGNPIPALAPPFVHECLDNGTTYYYAVAAVNPFGESAVSTEAAAVPENEGVLDLSLAGRGWVVHDNAAGGSGQDYGNAVVMDNARRIVVAGNSLNADGYPDMAIWRYHATGLLDPSFGVGGFIVYDNGMGATPRDYGNALVIEGSGRIIVAGSRQPISATSEMTVWAYDEGGNPDPSFGAGGIVTHSGAAGGSLDWARGVAIDMGGKIVVAGASENASSNLDVAVWRIQGDGTPDPTFGTGGVVTHEASTGGSFHDEALDVAIDATGRICVAGSSWSVSGRSDVTIWTFLPGGSLDPSFGSGGFVIYDGGEDDFGSSIAVDTGGRILVCGSTIASMSLRKMVVLSYDSAGVLDGSFGSGGIVIGASRDPNDEHAGAAIELDPMGRIYVAGRNNDMVIWRYDSTGAIDLTFGFGGVTTDDAFGTGLVNDAAFGLALDACGEVLVTGIADAGLVGSSMVIWRYH